MKILRLRQVSEQVGRSRSRLYADVHAGLLPPFVKIGLRTSGLPDTEVDAVVKARVAGKTHDEIRCLVKELTAARRAA